MTTARRSVLGMACAGLICLGITAVAGAANPIQLVLSQGAAFSILGRSCGGIQEQVFATGFAANGYPQGDVYLSTRCGGSGRGGGYKYTTYTAWAAVTWDWFGETRSAAPLQGTAEQNPSFTAEDAHGDRIYNAQNRAYLETGEPPLAPPAAPTAVNAAVSLYEAGETEYLRMTVTWSADPETAGLITSSTVTATPVKPGPPVLTGTASGGWSSVYLGPVQPSTTYRVTVTNTDAEGTSEAGTTEVTSPNSDGEAVKTPAANSCEVNSGTIKLSPGLSETPHVQNITIKGVLRECGGPALPSEGTYVAHLQTTEEVTCSVLGSISAEPTTTSQSLVVKWAPKEEGTSHGSLVVPLTEVEPVALSGTLEGGPLTAPASITGGTIYESFAGGPACGLAEGKKKPKAVKSGTFSGALELG